MRAPFTQAGPDGDQNAFFTNGDDHILQERWAEENGLRRGLDLEDILLAQIESHRAEVFYNLDPMRYGERIRTATAKAA